MIRLNDHGSTTAESAAALFILAILMSAGLTGAYLSFAKVWVNRSAYEAAVCLGSTASETVCKKRLRVAIDSALPIGQSENLSLRRTSSMASVTLSFRVHQKLRFRVHEQISLPLSSPSLLGGVR